MKPAETPLLRPPEKEGPSATCAIVRVPFEHEESAIQQLRALGDDVFSLEPMRVPAHLWTAERIELAYEELREAGFDIPDVEAAIRFCGPTVSDCFDFLSLTLPAARLPKGWAAEGSAESATAKKQLSVARASASGADTGVSTPPRVPSPPPAQHRPAVKVRDAVAVIDKAWIMKRYQEMDSASDEEAPPSESEAIEQRLAAVKQHYAEAKLVGDAPERTRLQAEIKELSLKLQTLKVAAAPMAAATVAATAPADDAKSGAARQNGGGDDDDDVGMGDMFDDETAAATTAHTATLPLFSGAPPAGWTAPPPRTVLAETLRKRMQEAPAFKPECSVPRHFRYSVTAGGETFSVPEWRCATKTEAMDLAATRALFTLAGKQSGVRMMLPPAHRDAWAQWADAEEQVRLALVEKDRAERLAFVRSVLDDVAHARDAGNASAATAAAAAATAAAEAREPRARQIPTSETLASELEARAPYRLFADHLPIYAVREAICGALAKSDFLVVVGETGSGKTTQVPVFLLEDAAAKKRPVRIAVAEPRRISATSVARRVGEELGDEARFGPGSLSAYAIRGESTVMASTRIMFCTTGVLLRQLQDDAALSGFSHVVVDEVHERSVDSDFLIIHLKRIVASKRQPPLKVILMSATTNAEAWSRYLNDAPIVTAQGRTFPVEIFPLEAALQLADYQIEADAEGSAGGSWQTAQVRMRNSRTGARGKMEVGYDDGDAEEAMDDSRVNIDLIECVLGLCVHAVQPKPNTPWTQRFLKALPREGAILVFLPGLADITRLQERLEGSRTYGDPSRFVLVVLHSSLTASAKDQRVAFDVPAPGVTKIVIATNIAETGVTIPDVTCVIDTCRANEIDFDERRGGLASLRERFISKANAQQRAGRAGRVRAGVCIRLVYEDTFRKFDAAAAPEMLRVPLDDVALRLLALKQPPLAFLSLAPDPPSANAVAKALQRLRAIGAAAGDDNDDACTCTALGAHLARLPLDARLGKLLILGSLFQCLDQVLTVAAAAGGQSSVFAPRRKAEMDASRRQFAWGDSDLLTTCRVYEAWRDAPDPRAFAKRHWLSLPNLYALKRTRGELLGHLRDAGFPCTENQGAPPPQAEVVAAVVLAGLYPQMAAADLLRGPRAMADPAKDVRIVCADGVEAHLIRGSVAFGAGRGVLRPGRDGARTRFLVYCERLRTSRVFLRDATPIPPAALLLFSGAQVDVTHAKRRVDVDGWVHLRVPPRTAALLSRARVALDREIVALLENPAVQPRLGPAAQLALGLIQASSINNDV